MTAPRRILIEGWRFLPHSYAVVNAFQILELLRRPGIELYHHDQPYYNAMWRKTVGLFSPAAEAAMERIGPMPAGTRADAVYRITFPYNLAPTGGVRVLVFGTAERACVPPDFLVGNRPLKQAHEQNPDAILLTPSNWSRGGFLTSGADPSRLFVVPHGIDPELYHPLEEHERQAQRQANKWNGFVFLSIGAMTENKGLILLLKALAAVAAKYPQVQLLLKGVDDLYPSKNMLLNQASGLTPAERELVQPRLHYRGETLSFSDIARLYQMADAYVSPYSAEGFNMPVLEAAASGLPVICTGGGSTDDFTRDDFALRISSREHHGRLSGLPAKVLIPDLNDLMKHMFAVVEQPEITRRARQAGPEFVQDGWTWKHVVDRMLEIMFL